MPAKGAAILSQIEGLLEQLTELDYESPVKAWASELMPEVNQMAAELRSQGEEGMEAEGYSAPRQGPKQFDNFGDAKKAAMTDHAARGGKFVEDEETETDDAEFRRRRKAKAA